MNLSFFVIYTILAESLSLKLTTNQFYSEKPIGEARFLNASLSELLGFPYVEALDYSSVWFGIQESLISDLRHTNIRNETDNSVARDTILRLVFGGSYHKVQRRQLERVLRTIQKDLCELDKSWEGRLITENRQPIRRKDKLKKVDSKLKREAGECVYTPKGPAEQCVGFFYELIRDKSSWRFDAATKRSVCMYQGRGRCCVSWLRDIKVDPLLIRDAWQTCRWHCFEKRNANCEVTFGSGGYHSLEISHVCFATGPDGCLRGLR